MQEHSDIRSQLCAEKNCAVNQKVLKGVDLKVSDISHFFFLPEIYSFVAIIIHRLTSMT